jgi:hypothetical protein
LIFQPERKSARNTLDALTARHSMGKEARNRSGRFSRLYYVSERPKRDCTNTAQGVLFGDAVCHDTRQSRYFGNPTAVLLTFKFN